MEYVLLGGLVALGVVLGLQTLAADTGEGALTSACQLLQKVGLGAGGCGGGGIAEARSGTDAETDLAQSQAAYTRGDEDIVVVPDPDRPAQMTSRDGLAELEAAQRRLQFERDYGGLELPPETLAGLVGGAADRFGPLPEVEGVQYAQTTGAGTVFDFFGYSETRTPPQVRPSNPNTRFTGPLPSANNLNRPPPGLGAGLLRALGLAGALVSGLSWVKELADNSIPPQLLVHIDDDNMLVMDWQIGGAALLGTVSDGAVSELRGLAMLRPGAILEATTSDGTVFAEKPLGEEVWTLHLPALPEGLAERIRSAPGLVWDRDLYGEMPTPMVPLAPGEQLVEFNGVVYVRNLNAGTLRPLMTLGDSQGALPDGAATMSAGPVGPGEGPGGRADGDVEDDADEERRVVEAPDGSPLWTERVVDGPLFKGIKPPQVTDEGLMFTVDVASSGVIRRYEFYLPHETSPDDSFLADVVDAAQRGDSAAINEAYRRYTTGPELTPNSVAQMEAALIEHLRRIPAQVRQAHFRVGAQQIEDSRISGQTLEDPPNWYATDPHRVSDGSEVYVLQGGEEPGATILVIEGSGAMHLATRDQLLPVLEGFQAHVNYGALTPILEPGYDLFEQAFAIMSARGQTQLEVIEWFERLQSQLPGMADAEVVPANDGSAYVQGTRRVVAFDSYGNIYHGGPTSLLARRIPNARTLGLDLDPLDRWRVGPGNDTAEARRAVRNSIVEQRAFPPGSNNVEWRLILEGAGAIAHFTAERVRTGHGSYVLTALDMRVDDGFRQAGAMKKLFEAASNDGLFEDVWKIESALDDSNLEAFVHEYDAALGRGLSEEDARAHAAENTYTARYLLARGFRVVPESVRITRSAETGEIEHVTYDWRRGGAVDGSWSDVPPGSAEARALVAGARFEPVSANYGSNSIQEWRLVAEDGADLGGVQAMFTTVDGEPALEVGIRVEPEFKRSGVSRRAYAFLEEQGYFDRIDRGISELERDALGHFRAVLGAELPGSVSVDEAMTLAANRSAGPEITAALRRAAERTFESPEWRQRGFRITGVTVGEVDTIHDPALWGITPVDEGFELRPRIQWQRQPETRRAGASTYYRDDTLLWTVRPRVGHVTTGVAKRAYHHNGRGMVRYRVVTETETYSFTVPGDDIRYQERLQALAEAGDEGAITDLMAEYHRRLLEDPTHRFPE